MKGFLARWVEQKADSEVRQSDEPEAMAGVKSTPEAATAAPPSREIRSGEPIERAVPWAEWKAAQLNQVFEQQGVTGKPGRITADTVRRSNDRDNANEANLNTKETTRSASPVSGEDITLREARHETASLLATAYRRHSVAKPVGTDPRKASGDDGVAKSGESSVHGVVP